MRSIAKTPLRGDLSWSTSLLSTLPGPAEVKRVSARGSTARRTPITTKSSKTTSTFNTRSTSARGLRPSQITPKWSHLPSLWRTPPSITTKEASRGRATTSWATSTQSTLSPWRKTRDRSHQTSCKTWLFHSPQTSWSKKIRSRRASRGVEEIPSVAYSSGKPATPEPRTGKVSLLGQASGAKAPLPRKRRRRSSTRYRWGTGKPSRGSHRPRSTMTISLASRTQTTEKLRTGRNSKSGSRSLSRPATTLRSRMRRRHKGGHSTP